MGDQDEVLKWAEEVTEIVVMNPALTGLCKTLGNHAKHNETLPPWFKEGTAAGVQALEQSGLVDDNHPSWISGIEDLELIILGVLQLAVMNLMIDTLRQLSTGYTP